MKIEFTLILVFLLRVNLNAQMNNPFEDNINWSQWEVKIPDSIKIREFFIADNRYKEHYEYNLLTDPNSEQFLKSDILRNLHFVDFNHDNKLDILFTGSCILSDCNRTCYYLNTGEKYKIIFEAYGWMININYIIPGVPTSINICDHPFDPGEILQLIETYNITRNSQNSITFTKSASTYVIDYTVIPDTFNMFIPFEVTQDKYNLRLSAKIDSTTDYFYREWYGNTIATYSKGSYGYALAERKDSTNRIWWFVLMKNNIKPTNSYYPDCNDPGWKDSPKEYYSTGWMSSRYLKTLK